MTTTTMPMRRNEDHSANEPPPSAGDHRGGGAVSDPEPGPKRPNRANILRNALVSVLINAVAPLILYDQLQHLYETSDNPEIKVSALSWLSQFEDPALIQRALEYAVSSKVRNQNAVDQLGLALQIDENRAQVWNFIQSHWNEVQAQFTTEMGARFVGWMYPFCTVEDRNSVQQFFSTHQVEAADVSLRHSLEVINGCIEFRSLQEANLKQWLASQP